MLPCFIFKCEFLVEPRVFCALRYQEPSGGGPPSSGAGGDEGEFKSLGGPAGHRSPGRRDAQAGKVSSHGGLAAGLRLPAALRAGPRPAPRPGQGRGAELPLARTPRPLR